MRVKCLANFIFGFKNGKEHWKFWLYNPTLSSSIVKELIVDGNEIKESLNSERISFRSQIEKVWGVKVEFIQARVSKATSNTCFLVILDIPEEELLTHDDQEVRNFALEQIKRESLPVKAII